MKKRNCFYVPGSTSIIDMDNNGLSHYGKKTLEQLREEYPTVILIDFDEAIEQINQAIATKFVTEPTEITEDDFEEALEVLPPLKYHTENKVTTFMIEEMTISHYTSIYCSIEGRYFSFTDSQFTSHMTIVEKVKNSQAYLSKVSTQW